MAAGSTVRALFVQWNGRHPRRPAPRADRHSDWVSASAILGRRNVFRAAVSSTESPFRRAGGVRGARAKGGILASQGRGRWTSRFAAGHPCWRGALEIHARRHRRRDSKQPRKARNRRAINLYCGTVHDDKHDGDDDVGVLRVNFRRRKTKRRTLGK